MKVANARRVIDSQGLPAAPIGTIRLRDCEFNGVMDPSVVAHTEALLLDGVRVNGARVERLQMGADATHMTAVLGSFRMKRTIATGWAAFLATFAVSVQAQTLYPANRATQVNADVKLRLMFKDVPRVGASGKIRIYDAADDRLVDTLDMSIPAGPTERVDPAKRAKDYLAFPYPYTRGARPTNANSKLGTPSAGAVPTLNDYLLTIIGGFTDGHPIASYSRPEFVLSGWKPQLALQE